MVKKLVFVLMLSLTLLSIVSAYDNRKWDYCNGINVSGGACDDAWTSLLGDVAKDFVLNVNMSNYYNRSEVDNMLAQLGSAINRTNNITINDSALQEKWENYTDFRVMGLRDSFTGRLDNISSEFDARYVTWKDYSTASKSGGLNDLSPLWIIPVFIVLGGGFLLLRQQGFMKSKTAPSSSMTADRKKILDELKKMNREANNTPKQVASQEEESEDDSNDGDELPAGGFGFNDGGSD